MVNSFAYLAGTDDHLAVDEADFAVPAMSEILAQFDWVQKQQQQHFGPDLKKHSYVPEHAAAQAHRLYASRSSLYHATQGL